MKKIIVVAIASLFLFWPQKKASPEETTTETLLNYQLVKNEVLAFQIKKRFIKIENKIDSLKKLKK